MKLSVAMCTYNGERFLEAQLRTIAEQTVLPDELVICDDGSTDGTAAIVARFAASANFPVHFHRNAINLGSTKNFEKAVSLCKGEFIALCDQDDLWMPEKLEKTAAALREAPDAAAVFSNARLIDDDSNLLPSTLWERAEFAPRERAVFAEDQNFFLIQRSAVTGATVVFRSSFLRGLVPFPPEWIHDEWLALMLSAVSKLKPVDEFLISYRLHTSQQIGLKKVTRRDAIRYGQAQRVAYQRRIARRLLIAADRLEPLPGTAKSVRYARRRAAYMEKRAVLLEGSRLSRIFTGVPALPGHFRHGSGLISYFRDLLHS